MMREITLGRYYAVSSRIHDLDPRTKLMGLLIFIVSLFLVRSNWTYLICLAVLAGLYRASEIPVRHFLRGLRGIILLLVFTFVFRTFFTDGSVLWSWWVFRLTRQGLRSAVRLVSRIGLMMAAASLLSYTTTPKRLSDGMEKALRGFRKFGLPVEEIALVITIAFRFIPVLNEEAGFLMDAQAARGADFESGGVWGKMRRMPALVIPLFVSALQRSSELATAMEARGCSGDNVTTRMNPLAYSGADKRAYVLSVVYLAAILLADALLRAV